MKSHWIATNSSKNQNSKTDLNDLYSSNINDYQNNVVNTYSIPREQKKKEISLNRIYDENSHTFEEYITNKLSKDYARAINLTMRKFFITFKAKNIEDIKNIMNKGKISKKTGSIAYRNFLNFMEDYSLMKIEEIDKYRRYIKIHNTNGVDRFVPSNEQVKVSLKFLIKNKDYIYYLLYRLLIESGARYTEIRHFINNFNEEYLEIDNDVCCYSNFYIRGKKSSYYLLFTKQLYNELKYYISKINDEHFEHLKYLARQYSEIQNLKYLRKVNFTLLLMNEVPYEVADLIAGRSQKGRIGMNHYMLKKPIVLKYYNQVIDKILDFNEDIDIDKHKTSKATTKKLKKKVKPIKRETINKCNRRLYSKSEEVRYKQKYQLIIRRLFKQIDNRNFENGVNQKYIGCSVNEFKEYIERQFTFEMNWKNRNKIWKIEYIKKFKDTKLEDLHKLIHYKNIKIIKK